MTIYNAYAIDITFGACMTFDLVPRVPPVLPNDEDQRIVGKETQVQYKESPPRGAHVTSLIMKSAMAHCLKKKCKTKC